MPMFALPELVRWLAERGRHDEAEHILAEIEARAAAHAAAAARGEAPAAAAEDAIRRTVHRASIAAARSWSGRNRRRRSSSPMAIPSGCRRSMCASAGLPVTDALAADDRLLGGDADDDVCPGLSSRNDRAQAALHLRLRGDRARRLRRRAARCAFPRDRLADAASPSALIMGLGTALNSSACVNYTAELYPTRMRGWGVATGSSMNRLASIISPDGGGRAARRQFRHRERLRHVRHRSGSSA